MWNRLLMVVFCALAVVACGGGDPETAESETAEPEATEPGPTSVVESPPDEAVGEALAPTLDVTGDGEYTITIELPEDATPDNGGRFGIDVALGPDWSSESVIKLDIDCADECGPQDWSEQVEAFASPIGRIRSTLVEPRDESIPNGWLLAGPNFNEQGSTAVVARWNNDADAYFTCVAETALQDADRFDELIDVCLSAMPLWFE